MDKDAGREREFDCGESERRLLKLLWKKITEEDQEEEGSAIC